MATLAFGLAGAAGGSFIGISPQTGFLIGSTIGRLLFPPDDIVTEGPRLGDLSVSSSTYGKAIPIGYGSFRMAGNMIWSSGIREQENRQSSGGKGGGLGGDPGQVQVTFTYFASFAMAFAEGEADNVIRIWADSRIIFDRSSGTNVSTAGLRFRFHSGNETQVPDPLIVADKGAGNVPGHRGLVYIVFDDLALQNFGNRIPNITAEIAFQAAGANTIRFSDDFTVAEGGLSDSISTGQMAIDIRRRRVYLHKDDVTNGTWKVYNFDSLSGIRDKRDSDVLTSGTISAGNIMAGFDTGNIYARDGAGNNEPIVRINPDTLAETDRSVALNGRQNLLVEVTILGLTGDKDHYLVASMRHIDDHLAILDADTMDVLDADFQDLTGDINGVLLGKSILGSAEVWVLRSVDGNNSITVRKMTIESGAGIGIGGGGLLGVDMNVVGTIPTSTWGTAQNTAQKHAVYDDTDDSLIFVIDLAGGATSLVFKWSEALGVVWSTEANCQAPLNMETMSMATRIVDGLFGFVDGSGIACMLRTEDGSLVVDGFDGGTLDGDYNPSGNGFFDAKTQSVINLKGVGGSTKGFLQQLFLDRATGDGETLPNILEDISSRVQLDPATYITTTSLVGQTVRGYVVTRQSTARAAIEPLSTAFDFDGVESDGRIKFLARGGASLRTLQDSELVVISDDTGDVVTEERIQEVELPERLSIQYADVNAEYEQGTQSVKRILFPDPTMRSVNERAVALPIALTATEAQQIAERVLFTAWNERVQYNFRSSWEQLDLDPADVVDLQLASGTTLQARIAQATINRDLTISFRGIREDSVTLISNSTAQGSLGFPPQVLPGPSDTRLFLLDIPLLRDIDDTLRVGNRLYVTMNGFVDNWTGGNLFDSTDSITFNNTGIRVLEGVIYGVLTNALPDTSVPFQTDTTTVLKVAMQVGDLASVTQAQFLNDESVALIGNPDTQNWEIVLFKDAVETVQADLWDVSTLMRGRRGTEVQVGGHAEGELFLVMSRDTVTSLLMDLSLLNVARFYRGVGFDQIVEDATTEPLSSAFNSLRPYAPAQLDAVVDGGNNIDFSWVRRTRVGGALKDGIGTVPLGEDSEEYELEVMDALGTTVVRTFTAIASPAQQYDNADIITDFGSVPAVIIFRVYQVSAQVGRGFRATATVTF